MTTTTSKGPARITFACTGCKKPISTLAGNAGRRGKCPHCEHVQVIPSVEARPTPPTVVVQSVTEMIRQKQFGGERQLSHVLDRISYFKLSRASLIALALLVVLGNALWIVYRVSSDPETLLLWRDGILLAVGLVIIWLPILTPALGATMLMLLAVHKVRQLRNIIYFSVWLGPLWLGLSSTVLGLILQSIDATMSGLITGVCCGFPWFLIGYWPARWITPYVVALFVHRLSCPSCGEEIELRSRWGCSCGYRDHRDILLFSCPKCRERIGYVDCPRCEATVLI